MIKCLLVMGSGGDLYRLQKDGTFARILSIEDCRPRFLDASENVSLRDVPPWAVDWYYAEAVTLNVCAECSVDGERNAAMKGV